MPLIIFILFAIFLLCINKQSKKIHPSIKFEHKIFLFFDRKELFIIQLYLEKLLFVNLILLRNFLYPCESVHRAHPPTFSSLSARELTLAKSIHLSPDFFFPI
jgi:hypothetical protein